MQKNLNFRIRNIHTWMLMQKCKELGIESQLLVPGKEDFLELKKKDKRLIINRAISPFLKHIPGAISEDKITCNYILQKEGFPIPAFIFSNQTDEETLQFLKQHAPIVVKPYDTNKGTEIHMDIRTPIQLENAMEKIRKKSSNAILQKQAEGKDYRILIIGGKVVGVLWNEWPFVIGDGEYTIQELVVQENKFRSHNKTDVYGKPTVMLTDIPLESLDEQLLKTKYTKEDVLPMHEKLYVGHCGNGWTGAIPHDVTDCVHPDILEKALMITQFLDIDVAGLDVRCIDITLPFNHAQFNLIEVNTRSSFVDHEFPTHGIARNVTEQYLNYLFP